MKKILRRILFLTIAMFSLATVAWAGGEDYPTIEPAEGYYLVKETWGSYNDNGAFVEGSDAVVYDYEFDDAGHLAQTICQAVYDGECVFEEITEYEYDESGNCVKRTETYNNELAYVYRYTYDAEGRQLTYSMDSIDSNGNVSVTYTIEYIYNSKGQLVRETDGEYYGANYTYDSDGNCICTEYDSGSITNYTYTKTSENLIVKEETDGSRYTYTYDAEGKCIKYLREYFVFDWETQTAGSEVWLIADITYKYDEYGNCIEETIYEWNLYGEDGETAAEYTYVNFYEYEKLGFNSCDTVINPFTDVTEDCFYYTPVLWAVENNITKGTTDTTFTPDELCTRGQVVTFLWRTAGCPEPNSTECKFTDVGSEDYYYKAVLWATENGVTNGVSETEFDPAGECTRGQVVTFLWRTAGNPASSGSNPFVDVENECYYYNAVQWAAENGITKGITETTFKPDDTCTRGQVVTFLYRSEK